MADLDKSDFEGKYNHPSTGLFKDNTSNDIGEDDVRALVEDVADSFTQTKYDSPSVAGATITCDFGDRQRGVFVFDTFSTAKAVAFLNDGNAKEILISSTIDDVAGTLEFPASVLFTDVRYETGELILTQEGKVFIHAIYDGTNWLATVSPEYIIT